MDAAVVVQRARPDLDRYSCCLYGVTVPTIANTAFGVSSIRKEYIQVAYLLQLSWFRRLLMVILPAAAPTIIAGLRISFGSALVAVVPAEMLLVNSGWLFNLD